MLKKRDIIPLKNYVLNNNLIYMDIGILGLGGVGKSFIKLLSQYGKRDDRIFGYDVQEVDLGEYDGKIELVESEEALGEQSDFLICCTDMLAGDGLRYAAAQMRPGTVVCDDFSAKTPAYDAIKESGALEKGVAYWSFHTMFSPKMGFDGQTVLDIPVSGCYTNGTIHPYIERTRQMIAQAGSKFKRIWSVPEHDMMTGRIQASVSAQNICTAKTLAGLGINPLEGNETYSGSLDINNFLMALRAIGPPGSSNHSVYGLIAMKNPYSMQNLDSYVKAYKTLIAVASESKNDAIDILKETREKLGWDRVGLAGKGWDDTFGEVGPTMNSFSSHLAEAIAWSESDAPVDVFQAKWLLV